MDLNTATKLRVARVLSRLALSARRFAGRADQPVLCRRGGIRWSLDLTEGIDLSIYLFGAFERATAQALGSQLFPGAVALDIGANIGAHALPMAIQVGGLGRVYAIEPTTWAFDRLKANRDLNRELTSRLHLLQIALTDEPSLMPSRLHSSWSLFEKETHPVHGGTLKPIDRAEILTLDALVERLRLERLDLIKLDVDGFEAKVLSGGMGTLRRFQPRLVMELAPYIFAETGDTFERLIDTLRELRYSVRRIGGDERELPLDAARLRRYIPMRGGINVLAVPPGSRP